MFNGQPVVNSLDDMHRLLSGWYEASALSSAADGQVQHQQALLAETSGSLPQRNSQPVSLLGPAQYAVIATAPDQHISSIMMDPQLRAVITAVSAYYRMGHHALIQCVRRLEQQMAAVESRLSFLSA